MKSLAYLNKYFVKYKYRLLLGILITIASKIFALQVPDYIRKTIDVTHDFIKAGNGDFEFVKSKLLYYISLIIGVTLLSGVFTFLMRQTIIVTSRYIEFDLKNEIYEHYQRLSINFYKKNSTGDLMNRISEDVSKVRMYFGPALMYSVNMVILLIIAMVNMYKIDTELTNYSLLPLPILSVSIYFLSKTINKKSTVVQEYLSKLTANSQEFFSGINIIKSFGIEDEIHQKFSSLSNTAKQKNINLYRVQALFFPLMILLIGLSNLLVIYIGGLRYMEGTITLGVIAEYIIYINMLTWPVAAVGWVTSLIQQAEASQKRINEFLKQQPQIISGHLSPFPISGNIEFKNVTFTYEDTNITALKTINFKLQKGKTLGVLGDTGSGKSTIIDLISRLYDPSDGDIFIDEKDCKTLNLASLRSQIGVVSQDSFLFSDTIKNNILYGNLNATDEEVIEIAKNVHIHHNIEKFKEGYNTIVGERGVMLSGGQKQRISIARALIKKPAVLIFDDCLASVDTETEEIILQNLRKLTQHKTSIIISHRASSVKDADEIIVLKKGAIFEQGTHKDLLEKDGYYKKIYQQQLMESAASN